MKIPKIFMPEKNLDAKTEEFKGNKESREVSLEDLMKKDMEILYGLIDYQERTGIIERAVSRIVNDTFENRIIWEKNYENSHDTSEQYTTKATILNYKKELITIPVLFVINKAPVDTWGILFLGNERGPSRNTYDKNVKKLTVEYFKIDPKILPGDGG